MTQQGTQPPITYNGEKVSTALNGAFQSFRWTPTERTIRGFINEIWDGLKQCLTERTGTNKIMVTLECRVWQHAGEGREVVRNIQLTPKATSGLDKTDLTNRLCKKLEKFAYSTPNVVDIKLMHLDLTVLRCSDQS